MDYIEREISFYEGKLECEDVPAEFSLSWAHEEADDFEGWYCEARLYKLHLSPSISVSRDWLVDAIGEFRVRRIEREVGDWAAEYHAPTPWNQEDGHIDP
jgi:hypothetical protein